MMWAIIVVVAIVLMGGYTIYMNKATKNYYLNNQDDIKSESLEIKGKIEKLVQKVVPDVTSKLVVNGHYITQKSAVVKVTTYYSYVIVYDEAAQSYQVVNYDLVKDEVYDCGFFSKDEISVADLHKGFNTNYTFKKAGEKDIIVQTCGHDLPNEGAYEIKYFQETEYNQLRASFGLSEYKHSNILKAGEK